MSSPFELIAAHKASESILNECVDLLSHVWRRNKQLRMQTLQNSCENLPTTLILVQKMGHKKHVLATAKLARVANEDLAVAMESVAVHPQIRGRGFGRYIMCLAEDYCRGKGFKKAYLWTHDQQCFYERLGYIFTLKNVVLFTGSSRMADRLRIKGGDEDKESGGRRLKTGRSEMNDRSSTVSSIPAPAPTPPPPLPVNAPTPPSSATDPALSVVPAPAPPPSPPLPVNAPTPRPSAPPPPSPSAPPAPPPSTPSNNPPPPSPSQSSNPFPNPLTQGDSKSRRSQDIQPSPLSEPPYVLHDLPTEERPGLVQRCQFKQCMMKIL